MSLPDTVTEHNIQLDVLRIVAIGAVIWLHTSAGVLYYGTNADAGINDFAWWVSDICDSLSRWCVPVFVMISGALLLDDHDTGDSTAFYQRRVRRLLPPLLFWSLFYLAYRHFYRNESYMDLLKDLINGTPYFHLWFLFMIFGLYAITPFLNVLLTYGNPRILFITTMAIFAIAIIEKTTALFSSEYTVHTTFLVLWLPFTAYFLMGYFVMKSRVRVSLFVTLVMWLLLSAVVAVEAAVVRFGLQKADVYDLPFDYFNPIIICVSLLMFAAMSKCVLRVSERGARRIQSLAAMTLGIYLIHVLWLRALEHVHLDGSTFHPVVGIPLTTMIVFSLSLATTMLLRSIPFLRRVV